MALYSLVVPWMVGQEKGAKCIPSPLFSQNTPEIGIMISIMNHGWV